MNAEEKRSERYGGRGTDFHTCNMGLHSVSLPQRPSLTTAPKAPLILYPLLITVEIISSIFCVICLPL